ncbi:MAG: DUF6142 family protein [Schaedlerella sp.]|nr:DUF6142 family protein [Schaedlerella sp.]
MSEIKKKQRVNDKEKRISSYNKAGTKLRHSKMGKISCALASVAFAALGTAILISVVEYKEAQALTGGLGISAIILVLMGIKASKWGRKEKDRKYLTCNIGLIMNILLLIGLVIIYVI